MNILDIFNDVQEELQNNGGQLKNNFDNRELPSGTYPVEVKQVQHRATPWGTEEVNMRVAVTSGEYEGVSEFISFDFSEDASEFVQRKNAALSIQIAKACGIDNIGVVIAAMPNAPEEAVANALEPKVGTRFVMELKITENKKKPEYPYHNYNIKPLQQEEAEIVDEDLPF